MAIPGPGKGCFDTVSNSKTTYTWWRTHSHNKLVGDAQLSSKLANLVFEELAEGLNELHSLSLDHTLCNKLATDVVTIKMVVELTRQCTDIVMCLEKCMSNRLPKINGGSKP
jgi:hypothetical protein